jgi:hypothetical protein
LAPRLPLVGRRRRVTALTLALLATSIWSGPARAGTLTNPIDPWQQTALSNFPDRSHWLQPWRGYLDTFPAARLRNAIGINFDVPASEAQAAARLLAESGFRRARIEEPWGAVNYDDRSRLNNLADFRARLIALRDNGIRPLVLLNAHHGAPTPAKRFSARITATAPQGAREVRLDAATASSVVPGRTGLDALHAYKAADILFTQVKKNRTASLSKPLPEQLAAGSYPATTLAYRPFQQPLLRGRPNPAFEETMAGWLSYVDVVTREARNTLGSTAFDVEIWNELSFGSDFLFANEYYDPDIDIGTGDTTDEILKRTVAWIRNPARGLGGVGIGNGFANQTPFVAGSTSPVGLTAIDKHPYRSLSLFPGTQLNPSMRPLDALGQPDGNLIAPNTWVDRFTPSYEAYFPEYFLSAIQAETLVRDISPISTAVYSAIHGRNTHPPGGPPPEVWITETGMDVFNANPPGTPPSAYLGAADIEHLRAKATLRAAVAFVNKGVSAINFYAAKDPNWDLIPGSFFDQVDASGGAYPGVDAGGATMTAMRRMMARFSGPDQISARQLSLQSISDDHDQFQFAGDGSSAHPPLYNRDVLAFLPFQVSDNRFVIPVYIMTRNIAKLYQPGAPASDPSRFDLPPASYRLTIGGVDGSRASVSAYDPLSDTSVPVTATGAPDRLVVEMPLTDSPRLLELDAPPPAAP